MADRQVHCGLRLRGKCFAAFLHKCRWLENFSQRYCSDKQLRAAYQTECGRTESCVQGEGDQGVLFIFTVSAYIEALISTHSAVTFKHYEYNQWQF